MDSYYEQRGFRAVLTVGRANKPVAAEACSHTDMWPLQARPAAWWKLAVLLQAAMSVSGRQCAYMPDAGCRIGSAPKVHSVGSSPYSNLYS